MFGLWDWVSIVAIAIIGVGSFIACMYIVLELIHWNRMGEQKW